ncbi:MAG: hypothetical protein HY079_09085, partial [Elusimicrobia bacterium]|nr:hypothetical protein [Elusimicrobiota bacterium]
MRMTTLALAAAALLAASASAGLFWRDKLFSAWTEKPLPVNADDSDWKDSSAFEAEGLGVLATNDADTLWLLVTARTRDARDLLVGETKQDLAVWFLAPDGKTRRWGVRLPYSHRESLATALRDPAGVDPQPELATWTGATVSTEAWPADLAGIAAIGVDHETRRHVDVHALATLVDDGRDGLDRLRDDLAE